MRNFAGVLLHGEAAGGMGNRQLVARGIGSWELKVWAGPGVMTAFFEILNKTLVGKHGREKIAYH